MKVIRKFTILFVTLFVVVALYFGGQILYGTITDFRPAEKESIPVKGGTAAMPDSIITFLTWNIGYGGLGEHADFFYDGGKSSVSPLDDVKSYLAGIYNTIKGMDSVQVFMLQELDTIAKRSHGMNELTEMSSYLPHHSQAFAVNYDVRYVPLPVLSPMGKVVAGLATFNPFIISECTRYQYPSQFSYPKSIYFLDRCFLVQRVPLASKKDLIIINTHNSAYDETGELKKAEMDHLRKYILNEYEAGNYVVVGGDWNQSPPGFDETKFLKSNKEYRPSNFDPSTMPEGWTWAADPSTPTNRDLSAAYVEGKTSAALIDYFLLSPNVELMEVKGIDMKFRYSDHQPVFMRVKLSTPPSTLAADSLSTTGM